MMEIRIEGGDVRYTVEQLAKTLLGNEDAEITCRMREGNARVFAHCTLSCFGKTAQADTWAGLGENEYENNHTRRLTAARALYRAYVRLTGEKPAWGMLSGVRPGKLVRARLEEGKTPRMAQRFLEKTYFVTPEKAALCTRAGKIAFEAEKSLLPRDILLYIHIPFCPSRCAYCSFVSLSAGDFARYGEDYLAALKREFDAFERLKIEKDLRVRAVYIGGGTPAILAPDSLSALCARVHALAPDAEFTVEAGRPDAITKEKLEALVRGGVSRVCVNPQTIHDETLARIGRKHTAQDFYRAYALAREAGFAQINVDLIAGLPGEDAAAFRESLDAVCALEPENITVHTLAVKRSSALNDSDFRALPARELQAMLDYAFLRLGGQDYAPYYLYRQKNMGGSFENAGFAKPGKACFYNICMMEEIGDVIALGAGASTKLTRGGILRRVNPKYPREYIAGIEGVLSDFEKIGRYFDEL